MKNLANDLCIDTILDTCLGTKDWVLLLSSVCLLIVANCYRCDYFIKSCWSCTKGVCWCLGLRADGAKIKRLHQLQHVEVFKIAALRG